MVRDSIYIDLSDRRNQTTLLDCWAIFSEWVKDPGETRLVIQPTSCYKRVLTITSHQPGQLAWNLTACCLGLEGGQGTIPATLEAFSRLVASTLTERVPDEEDEEWEELDEDWDEDEEWEELDEV